MKRENKFKRRAKRKHSIIMKNIEDNKRDDMNNDMKDPLGKKGGTI